MARPVHNVSSHAKATHKRRHLVRPRCAALPLAVAERGGAKPARIVPAPRDWDAHATARQLSLAALPSPSGGWE